jgi:acyl carrier protein
MQGQPMNELMDELRIKMIQTLDLEDVRPEDIGETDSLVGGDLGLDSIDILELVMMLDKEYGVKIDNKELGAKVFVNLGTLARYVGEHSARGTG